MLSHPSLPERCCAHLRVAASIPNLTVVLALDAVEDDVCGHERRPVLHPARARACDRQIAHVWRVRARRVEVALDVGAREETRGVRLDVGARERALERG
eukprot:6188010-Pleurochrysis_carterae.AAC.3